MKVSLVKIGNSRGVRLPKAVLEQCGFGDMVEMTVQSGKVVLGKPERQAREGWAAAFAAADTSPTDEDREWLEADLGETWDDEAPKRFEG